MQKRIPLYKWRVELNFAIFNDKKISDLQRRLDAQYDRIDEVEETMAELKSQIYELKKNQIEQIAYTDF